MSDDDRPTVLDELAEEFVARQRGGESPAISEYERRHPELAADIREIFPMLAAMEEVRSETRGETLPGKLERVGDYRLLREIGRGGMGIVYEAEQETLGRRVALKVLPTSATLDPRFLERFRIEAQAAARLQHPHIVPVIGYGQHEDVHYYTMQFIDGRGLDEVLADVRREISGVAPSASTAGSTLARRLLREDGTGDGSSTDGTMETPATSPGGGPRAVGRAYYDNVARLALHAAEGLAHAHANGVLHRDMKPSNLLLDGQGHLWITDFGLCKQEGAGADLTRTGDVLGTFRYMAPERFQGDGDVRSDVYGLGITLYELATRRRAYDEENRAQLAAKVASEPPPRPRSHDPHIPADLETIVRKATARDPARRYPTAEAFADDLRAYLERRPIAARAPTAGYLLKVAMARHKALTATLAVAGLVLLTLTVWFVLNLRDKESRARFRQYVAGIAAAESALRVGDTIGAARILEETPPELRNWEWRHMRGRVDDSLIQYPSTGLLLEHVAYAPDGKHVAVIVEAEVWIYDTGTRAVVERFRAGAPYRVAWHPDGSKLAVAGWRALELRAWPGATRLWSVPVRGRVSGLAWSPSGDALVAGSTDGGLRVHAPEDGAERQRLAVPSRIHAVAMSPTGTHVAVGSWDGVVTLFDLAAEVEAWRLDASTRTVRHLAFVGDDRLAVATAQAGVRIYAAADGSEHAILPHAYAVDVMVASPDGRHLLASDRTGLRLWDVATQQERFTIRGLGRTIKSMSFHPSGRWALAGTNAGTLTAWHVGDGHDLRALRGHMDDVHAVTYDPNGRFIATVGVGGIVRLWDAGTSELVRIFVGHHGWTEDVTFSPDGTLLASADKTGLVLVHEVRTGAVRRRLELEDEGDAWLVFAAGGKRLVVAGQRGWISAWDLESGKRTHRVHASSSADEATDEANPHLVGLSAAALSPDGRHYVTGDGDGVLRVWDAMTLAPLRAWAGHAGMVRALAFHPHGRLLASVSIDHTLKLWDPATGRAIATPSERKAGLSINEDALESVAFSPDGTRIVTGGRDSTIKVWGTDSRQLLATLRGPGGWVHDVTFSPDGERVVSGHGKAILALWETTPLRARIAAVERARPARDRAARIVATIVEEAGDADDVLARVEAAVDLEPAVREAALRIAHQRRGTREALIARIWRDLSATDADAERRRVARGLCEGLARAAGHQARQDHQLDVLMGMAAHRTGDPTLARRWLDRALRWSRQRDPALEAAARAFDLLAAAALDEPPEALREALAALDALLADEPGARTSRNLGFRAEAAAALGAD